MTSAPNFCENCGAKLNPVDKFCTACGQSVNPAVKTEAASPELASAASVAGCIKCGKPSLTAAETIVLYEKMPEKDNPSKAEEEAENRRYEVVDFLAQPEKPAVFSIQTWIILLFIPVINVLSVFFSPLVRGLKAFMVLMTLIFIGFVIWYSAGTFEPDFQFTAKDITSMAGFIWVVLYLISLFYSKSASKGKYTAELAEFEKIAPRWEHLHYCEKCGEVFFDNVPGRSARVEDTQSFLNS
jgi:hypothetical protein